MANLRKRGKTSYDSPKHSKFIDEKKENSTDYSPIAKLVLLLALLVLGAKLFLNQNFKAVNVPFSENFENSFKNLTKNFWGSYRPQVYMGMKTKSKESLVTGLMWMRQNRKYPLKKLRHSCKHEDKLKKYGWIKHDGVNFGVQNISDQGFNLKTQFVKIDGGENGGDWSWRVSATTKSTLPVQLSLFFYAATENQGNVDIEKLDAKKDIYQIKGQTSELGKFTIKFPRNNNEQIGKYNAVNTWISSLDKLDSVLVSTMVGYKKNNLTSYYISPSSKQARPAQAKSQVVFHQVTMTVPFDFEVVFESESKKNRVKELSGTHFTETLNHFIQKFDEQFEKTFPLHEKGYSKDQISFAQSALSNMVGGIGHFYGKSLVMSEEMERPVEYWPAHLLTAVPSRSFFPRGFLWDEGFHQLLIGKWNSQLSMEIIQHWLNLMNHEGWIPREQILGPEARSKVPAEFVVQKSSNANPPALFLSIDSLIKNEQTSISKNFLMQIYPRLKAWYNWFNTTQNGPLPSTYRWKGRDANSNELNPKTLTSGLDDYPRASHPSDDERHLDLRCWMALASKTMSEIAEIIGEEDDIVSYKATYENLVDPKIMDKMHWNNDLGIFSDYGNHSTHVSLQRRVYRTPEGNHTYYVKVVKSKPKLGFVDTFGYVSLFPMLLMQLQPDSPRLTQLLQDLPQSDLLWSEFGLRSLSARDPLYMKYNTQHDPPYWRGQVWININFLACRALHHYANTPGINQQKAQDIYKKLRRNIVNNLYKQWKNTGYIWEQYNDKTGKGQGTHPFTGWSALVVLIMSEQY